MTAAADRFVQLDGERLHYLEAGAGEGAPLVLLHTGGASAHEFEDVVPLLADRHRVIAWDMPGHGDSDPLWRQRSIERYADDLRAFLDALGIERAILVGVSIGGYIAMDFARRWPERVARAVLAESPLRSPAWYAENWPAFEAMCAIPTTSFDDAARRFRALTPAQHQRWNIDRNKAGSWTVVSIAWSVRDFDAQAALAALHVPLTIVMGAAGPTVQELDRWKAIQPDARYEELGGCGHFVMIDAPAAFAAAIEA
ncbi:alpha/beta fold hydrolase [Sphingomonas histidinilytica]|jgi:pimeloyl-ACP methyl ester carboxylesterase|uniref:Pimeloyl-ACP methyl ester carboxylesterase n=1 Tax=Rhizorhabdus histidinilytica TaxID=439228 RepID=A0A1T5FNF0_9SPHN|nr:alpha/beta hydrolase [Rhizorhabdus histidinilytica]MBO9377146.1 alpha/beta fold hydrolase [Rhizorhabdus histidinilytica]QEH79976.1 alpha/beta hydrolase [Sphingomonas sp. C8-2]SKB97665.1 Pimeloyl-ACP methyl ester carboxylesterase [Rhizorhabdus histidinilytica]